MSSQKRFEKLMSDCKWRDSLTKIEKHIKKLNLVKKEIKKLERAEDKYGSYVAKSRVMTLTNFDDIKQ